MSKRLQVLLDDGEFRELQRVARRYRMTVSAWIRQLLRDARRREPGREPDRKLEAVRAAVRHEFPAADIQQMLQEIESGYLADRAP